MTNVLKDFHMGSLINIRMNEMGLDFSRVCNFFKLKDAEIKEMFNQKSLDSEMLLKWSKLLKYDFFRLYSQHLILYSPQSSTNDNPKQQKTNLLQFRENIYTKEIIEFIIELVNSGEKSRQQVIDEYRIPKTTLYKWVVKYKK